MLGNIFESFVFGFGVTKEKEASSRPSGGRLVTLVDEFGATIPTITYYCIVFVRDYRFERQKSAVDVDRK